MRKTFSGLLLLSTVLVLIGQGVALAATSTEHSQAQRPPVEAKSDSLACLAPLTAATGGLCCPGTQSSTAPCVSSTPGIISAAEKKLDPLAVHGVQIPLPIVLQMIKKALQRGWSSALADRGLMVCEYRRRNAGSGSPILYCNTNAVYFNNLQVDASNDKLHCLYHCFLTRENIITALIGYINDNHYAANVLPSLLNKAPAASATYSLRVPETIPLLLGNHHSFVKYPAFVTFVMGNGHLTEIELAKRKGKIKVVKKPGHYLQSSEPTVVWGQSNADLLCTVSNLQC